MPSEMRKIRSSFSMLANLKRVLGLCKSLKPNDFELYSASIFPKWKNEIRRGQPVTKF